jgi:hypothetical protein
MATRKMSPIDRMLIVSVIGIRSPIFSATGRPSGEKLSPKSSVAIRPSHRPYWMCSGWSRP